MSANKMFLYNSKLKKIIKIYIDINKEYQYIKELLNCEKINIYLLNDYNVLVANQNIYNGNDALTLFEGINIPIKGNLLISGKLTDEGYLTSINKKILEEEIIKKINTL